MAQIHDELRAEGVVKDGSAVSLTGGDQAGLRLASYGRAYLTSERLVFLQYSRWFSAFGLLGVLGRYLSKPRKVAISIPLASITDLERTKYAANKSIMAITYDDGDTARITLTPYEEWEQAVQSARTALVA
jgi:hypothetical protein